ncbi:MAG: hypothetical protein KGK12_15470, partial [Armatimonadetes bacterium]|nr:hypothetical protein [Armatimonadota bacterium]
MRRRALPVEQVCNVAGDGWDAGVSRNVHLALKFANGAFALTLLLICSASSVSAQSDPSPPISSVSSARQATVGVWNLPQSCSVDFSGTLQAPAGQHGMLQVGADGHFVFADGTRARFWGINVSSTRLDIPDAEIEHTVRLFADTGLNLVRLEAVDNRNCLLGPADARTSRRLDRRYLDKLDRWMDALRRHGIYYYLDLLDLRTFKSGDGVEHASALRRGARPYALFDPTLIALQKRYAHQLLTHRNPYSGLRPIDDPALAMVEICNENGFFLYPARTDGLIAPYADELQQRWNVWLQKRYASRDNLVAAWTDASGAPGLQASEDPWQLTTALPLFAPAQAPAPGAAQPAPDPRRSQLRVNDGVRFLCDVQSGFFADMRSYLRSIGLRVPVTGVVSSEVPADIDSVAASCDFTAENWYGDAAQPDPTNAAVVYYGDRQFLDDDSAYGFAPYTAALRWDNKPVVVREWAVPWPNDYRAASVPEVLAYASLQDLDAVLLFGYQTNRALNGVDCDALNDLAFEADPTVWGQYAIAGQAFLRGAIAPAKRRLTICYPADKLFSWPSHMTDLLRAAWFVRVYNSDGSVQVGDTLTPSSPAVDVQTLHEYADHVHRLGGAVTAAAVEAGIWRSDTGQITLDTHAGNLFINTPTLQVFCGVFEPKRVYRLGQGLRFSTDTPYGSLLVWSQDGAPISQSQHLVAKMVSQAENTGQLFEPAPKGAPGGWVLRLPGSAPVVTDGQTTPGGTSLWMVRTGAGRNAVASLLKIGLK